jgi:hypothetical protein
VQYYCAILLYNITVQYYCTILLCNITVQYYCTILLCNITVQYYCAILLCNITVQYYCTILLCNITVQYYCTILLCNITVQYYCTILLCNITVQYYCALTTCRNVVPHMYWADRTINYWCVNLAIFVHGMKYLKSAFLCRTESLICRMPTLFGSPRLLTVMASFRGNSEEEAVFEDTTDEPYKRLNSISSLCCAGSTVL